MIKSIILFISLVILISCKKNEAGSAPEAPYYPFQAGSLDYVQLSVDRFYIYKDSATSIEDSVVVVRSDFEKVYVPARGDIFSGNLAYYYQVYRLTLQSKITMKDWFSGAASSGSSEIVTLNTYYNNHSYTVFMYPVTDRLIPSMEVQGKIYENVEQYEFDYPAEGISFTYYWAKEIGIIKRSVKMLGVIKTEVLSRHG